MSIRSASDITLFSKPIGSKRSLRKGALALAIGLSVLLVVLLGAGMLCQPASTVPNFVETHQSPDSTHVFGTDWLGRDMAVRIIAGLSISVGIGLGATLVSSLIGLILAMIAGLGGHRADAVISWFVDLMLGIPQLILLILISFALGKGIVGVVVGIGLTHWPSLCRVLRAEILQSRTSGAVTVAKRLGQSRMAIARHHLLPAIIPQFFIGIVLTFPHAVLHEAALTFLGFGLPLDIPSIGGILSESMGFLTLGDWWLALFPGLALLAVVTLFYGLGSSLRTLLDPFSSQR